MWYRTNKKARITKLACATALLLGLSLMALRPVPSAHAHGSREHESPRQIPAVPTTPGEAHNEHADPTVAHVHSEAEKHSAMQKHPETKAPEATPAHPYPPEGVPRPLAWLGKFHPLAVHFPIAMLIGAALSELLLMRTRHELFFHATRFAIWVGSLGALAAATLGWFFAGFRIADEEWLMTTHRWLGTSASALALAVLFLCERAYRRSERQAFRLALFPLAAVVATTGFFGGALLYGIDHYAW
jgi:uncharacterized membrane protein